MPTPSPVYPQPMPGDPSPVTQALEAGGADWGRGDLREAVRWVHRAADAAESAGDDARAVGLARAAADLMTALGSKAPSHNDEAAALAPFDDFNDQTIVDSPAELAARATQQSNVVIHERPSTPPPKPARPAPPSSKSAPPPAVKSVPPPRPTPPPQGQPSAAGSPQARTALRVAVVRDPQSQRVLVANILDEGVPPPPGSTEALLVVLDPTATLL